MRFACWWDRTIILESKRKYKNWKEMLQPIQYGERQHYTRVEKRGFCFTVGDFIGALPVLSMDQTSKSSAIKCLIKVYFGQRCEIQWSLDAYLGKSSTSHWYPKTRPSWWWLHPQPNESQTSPVHEPEPKGTDWRSTPCLLDRHISQYDTSEQIDTVSPSHMLITHLFQHKFSLES